MTYTNEATSLELGNKQFISSEQAVSTRRHEVNSLNAIDNVYTIRRNTEIPFSNEEIKRVQVMVS